MNNTETNEGEAKVPDGLTAAVRKRRDLERSWETEGEPSMLRFVGQIGILGWTIVGPTLIGLFVGRWLDRMFGTGIFWSAPLLMLGAALGAWSAWRWVHRQ